MKLLRTVAPALSFLLTALVVVQSLDLVLCADEAIAADHANGYHLDGATVAGAHPSPSPGANHDDAEPHGDDSGRVDCLCHVVWTRTEHLPEVASAPARPPAPFAALVAHPPSVPTAPLDHVPLA